MFEQFREKLEEQSHKAIVGKLIFCPICDHVMDYRSSSSITVWNENQIVYHKTFCTKHLQPGYKQAQEDLCKAKNLRAEIYHGKTGKLEIIGGELCKY